MNQYKKPAISYLGQLGILLGLVGVFFIVAMLAMIGLWMGMTGKGIFTMEKDLTNPAFTNAARYTQLAAAFFMFMVPAVIFARIINPKPFTQLGFNGLLTGKQFLLVVGISFAGMMLSGGLGTLNELIPVGEKWQKIFKAMEDKYNEQVLAMAKINGFKDYIFSLIVIALAPAVFEEVLFRGALQRLFTNWFAHAFIAILLTSILFSAIHFSFYGFLARVGLGMVLGYVFYFTRNIWLNILMHFINNGIAVTYLYFLARKGENAEAALKENFPLYLGVIGLTVVLTLLYFLKKESTRAGALSLYNASGTIQQNIFSFETEATKAVEDNTDDKANYSTNQ